MFADVERHRKDVYRVLKSMEVVIPPSKSDDEFLAVHSRLFGIAYRMLGSVAEAEDLVQDTYLRWHGVERGAVRDATAFLVTTITRLAINTLQSARVRRESYIGPWLPEPVSTLDDPFLGAVRSEALHVGTLVLMEKLTPSERAAYVLRKAFDYGYDEIADLIQTSAANVRQLVSRARKHLASGRNAPVSALAQRRLLEALLQAARTADMAALEALFAEDVVAISDGGGAVNAARLPIVGRDRVSRFFVGVAHKFWMEVKAEPSMINGAPAWLLLQRGAPFAVLSVATQAELITDIYIVVQPSKLSHFSPGISAEGVTT